MKIDWSVETDTETMCIYQAWRGTIGAHCEASAQLTKRYATQVAKYDQERQEMVIFT